MFVNQIYDIDSVQESMERWAPAMEGTGRAVVDPTNNFADNSASVNTLTTGTIFARQYQYIDPTILEKKYPTLAFMGLPVETDNSGGYASKILTLRLEPEGEFKFARDRADNLGRISMTGEGKELEVYPMQAMLEWTDDEVQEHQLQNINYVGQLMSAMVKQYQRELDMAGLMGVRNNPGLLTQSVYPATTAAMSLNLMPTQTMYDTISKLIEEQWTQTANTPEYKATVVLLPVNVKNVIAHRVLNAAGSEMSVLKALEINYPEIAFIECFRCDAENFADGMSRTLAFNPGPECLKFRLPLPLQIGEIIREASWKFAMRVKFRLGGVDFFDPTCGRMLINL